MDCPKCGAESYDDAAFCTLCYTKFGISQPEGEAESGSGDSTRVTPTEGIVGPKRPAGHGLAGKTGAPVGHARPITAVDFSDPAVRAGLLGEKPGILSGLDGASVTRGLEAGLEVADVASDAGMLLEGLGEILGSLSGD
jgi:hypothetical protein